MSYIHQDASQRAADIIASILSRRRAEEEVTPAGEIEVVPECRVLYRDGAPTGETLTQRPRLEIDWTRHLEFDRSAAVRPPAPKPQRQAVAPAPKKPKRNPRPSGRGKSWAKIPGLTEESVSAGILAGKTMKEIAAEHNVNPNTINMYLMRARRKLRDFAVAEDAMKVCACGATKRTSNPICAWCRKRGEVCSVEGCGNRAKVKGWCIKHYHRQYKAQRVQNTDSCALEPVESLDGAPVMGDSGEAGKRA